ncbi:MAG TPA: PfkB family carbohydrate kinase, partial [Pseudoxanthomonas sp.]|nr:PfkB family carbohydrate kinase [Pseudoxanthomonas sp.]
SPVETIEAALALAREAGVVTLLNPAPANASSSIGLLRLADVLTPNETEFAALLARHVGERVDPESVAALGGGELHALCRKLLPHGSVVVTLGSIGVFVSHPDAQLRGDAQSYYRIGAESVAASDTTGAGDAFNGALAASLAAAPEEAFAVHVRFANRYAAVSTERPGAALSMPLLAEVRARFPG